jgi:small GTP-binding protein
MYHLLKWMRFWKTPLEKKLDECKKVANYEATLLENKVEHLAAWLEQSSADFDHMLGALNADPDLDDVELRAFVAEFVNGARMQLSDGLDNIRQSLSNKKKNVDGFTLTLFGRTKSGKSTLREALTNGDGQTIGKGSQRTTRDILRYKWKHFQVIDTPGIAAFKGDEDFVIAESVIDETDVVLFLITDDSFQPAEFKKLEALKGQNKPIVILLNVKRDIHHPVHREKFLHEFRNVISLEGQAGNVARIKKLAREHFGHSSIDIIPIHAMAAFIATQEPSRAMARKLHEASGIDMIGERLEQLVLRQGVQKRVLTFRDDYIFYLNGFEDVCWEYYRKLRGRVDYLRKKRDEMEKWFDKFIPRSNHRIEQQVEEFFSPLFNSVDDFVDRHAGSKNASSAWERRFADARLQEKVETLASELLAETKGYLSEFSRQIKFDIAHIGFDIGGDDVGNLKQSQVGRVARWTTATIAAVDGTLALGALLNWWNPAGWVMGTLAVFSGLVGIFAWWWGDDAKAFEREKKRAKDKLNTTLERSRRKAQSTLKSWFHREVTKGISKKIKLDLRKQIEVWDSLLKLLRKQAVAIRQQVYAENAMLFVELIRLTLGKTIEAIDNIARIQGSLCKFLVRDNTIALSEQEIRQLESVVHERVVAISWTDDPVELLVRAMRPAKIERRQISFDQDSRTYKISVRDANFGTLVGKKHSNLTTAARIVRAKIDLVNC